MRILKILLLSLFLSACTDGVYWNDGNYTVYKCCGQDFYALGYEINGNGWEGLIDNVIAVGSNDNYVVVKAVGEKYFVVEKVKNGEHWKNRALISIAQSREDFMKSKEILNLPKLSKII